MSKLSAHQRRARDFIQREDWAQALSELQHVLEADAANPTLHNQVGDIYLHKDDVQKACEHFERAIELYASVGLHNSAVALCKKVMRLRPGRVEVRYRLARLRLDQGFRAEAAVYFGDYLDHMRSDTGDASAELEARCREIVELLPEDAPVGKILEKLEGARRFTCALDLVSRMAQVAADAGDDRAAARYTEKMRSLRVLVERSGGRDLLSAAAGTAAASVISASGLSLGATPTESPPLAAVEAETAASGSPQETWTVTTAAPATPAPPNGAARYTLLRELDLPPTPDPARLELAASLQEETWGRSLEAEHQEEAPLVETPEWPVPELPEPEVSEYELQETSLAEVASLLEAESDTWHVETPVWTPAPAPAGGVGAPDVSGAGQQVALDQLIDSFREQMAQALDGDGAARYDLGVAYYEMGLYNEALAEFEAAARCIGLGVQSLEMIASCLLQQGRHAEMVEILAPALGASEPASRGRVGLQYLLGLACEALGQWEQARRHFEEVALLDVDFKDVRSRLQQT